MAQKKVVDLRRIENDKTRITTYKKRKACLYKKAEEFSTLCGVQTCLIVYGPTKATDTKVSEPEIWPRDEAKVREIIRKYKDLASNGCGKETQVETFVNDLGKAKEKEDCKKRVKSNNTKYCCWEEKLDKCSQEQLRQVLYAVEYKLHEALMRQKRTMIRNQHQAIETPIPQMLMDQDYMRHYLADQKQQIHQGMLPGYHNMGFSLLPSPDDQNQMDPNLEENYLTNFGLTQGLMMPNGNDGTQLMQRQAQPCYNPEPVAQRTAAFNANPFAGFSPFNHTWR
ncbi:unnamed protein product [Microthlaspi erraticum]|uniref:MADS-box domain-containing protein n=1 Tax=Microthlaspi erraticum TaxID=1685480 RepID=A0A6D2II88_9BRAS|nr:unnamed protein product [Microthlaspi erraticum]CAA7032276.1 unnamed protein product [Microthlaspi erraticum]